jgi:hypothetical protein
MKKINIIIAIFLLTFCISCDEEFLEQEYVNGLVEQNFFTNAEHAEKALTAVYDVLGFEGQYSLSRVTLGSASADDVSNLHGDQARVGLGLIEVDSYNWHPSSRYINDHWYSCYKGVGRANQLLVNIGGIEDLSAGLSSQYSAEAKALRALFYYNLVTAYGTAPLILEPITLEESREITNSTEAELWAQIIKDFSEAAAVLPAVASQLGRVTSGFANAMLAKSYLWTKEYNKALVAANKVTGYTLEANYMDLFDGTVENTSTETILDVMNTAGSPTENIWWTETSEVNRLVLTGPFFSWSQSNQPARPFIDNFFEAGDIRVEDAILDKQNGDTYDLDGDGVLNPNSEIPDNNPVLAHSLKWLRKGADLTSGAVWSGGLQDVNINIMRYSEVLLIKAEALNEDGKTTDALIPLNLIRVRAGLSPIVSASQSELRDIILHENGAEFCFEGHRFFDLKRANKLNEVLSPLGWVSGKMEVFPIPQSEIDLTNLVQNPNY